MPHLQAPHATNANILLRSKICRVEFTLSAEESERAPSGPKLLALAMNANSEPQSKVSTRTHAIPSGTKRGHSNKPHTSSAPHTTQTNALQRRVNLEKTRQRTCPLDAELIIFNKESKFGTTAINESNHARQCSCMADTGRERNTHTNTQNARTHIPVKFTLLSVEFTLNASIKANKPSGPILVPIEMQANSQQQLTEEIIPRKPMSRHPVHRKHTHRHPTHIRPKITH